MGHHQRVLINAEGAAGGAQPVARRWSVDVRRPRHRVDQRALVVALTTMSAC
jgi:hypothetical protein